MTVLHRISLLDHTSIDIVVVSKVALLVGAEGASAFVGWILGSDWFLGSDWESESCGQAGEDDESDLHDEIDENGVVIDQLRKN